MTSMESAGIATTHGPGKYRTEIDGLRAIAVGIVVLYHFGLTRFGLAGFVGVDVFFVISGYLITSTLQDNVRSGMPGIAEFYRRRILRIFPALFVLLLVCAGMEIAVKFVDDIPGFVRAFSLAILFSSNFLFAQDKGYFDFDSRDNTLLHTWSLSVEEQFYLILPFLLLAMMRFPSWGRYLILFGCALASLVAAEIYIGIDQNAAFYLTPFRIWELLLGSALSLRMIPQVRNRIVGEVLSALGVLMILVTAVTLRSKSPFPGLNALGPVLGTVLVLLATENVKTITGRLLSLWPMRIVGLASYSFYLWHWPVFVYSKYFFPSSGRPVRYMLVALSFALALLSWRYIERPIRERGRHWSTRNVLLGGVGAMAALLLLSVVIVPIARAIWPANPGADRALHALKNKDLRDFRAGTCFGEGSVVMAHQSECLPVSTEKPNILLMGDSHVAQLWRGLRKTYPGMNFLQATAGSCTIVQSFGNVQCDRLMTYMSEEFLPKHRMKAIILGGRWSDGDSAAIKKAAEHLLAYADEVIVVGPFQDYALPFSEVVARSRYSGNPSIIEYYRVKETVARDKAMAAFDWGDRIHYVSGMDVMCKSGCVVADEKDNLMMFDNEHLSITGSEYFARHATLPGFPAD